MPEIRKRENLKTPEPKTLYAAYIPNGEMKRYLSDAKGRPAFSTSETQLREYLRENLTAENFAAVVIHPIGVNPSQETAKVGKRKRHKKGDAL